MLLVLGADWIEPCAQLYDRRSIATSFSQYAVVFHIFGETP